jgi:hypothetical protein
MTQQPSTTIESSPFPKKSSAPNLTPTQQAKKTKKGGARRIAKSDSGSTHRPQQLLSTIEKLHLARGIVVSAAPQLVNAVQLIDDACKDLGDGTALPPRLATAAAATSPSSQASSLATQQQQPVFLVPATISLTLVGPTRGLEEVFSYCSTCHRVDDASASAAVRHRHEGAIETTLNWLEAFRVLYGLAAPGGEWILLTADATAVPASTVTGGNGSGFVSSVRNVTLNAQLQTSLGLFGEPLFDPVGRKLYFFKRESLMYAVCVTFPLFSRENDVRIEVRRNSVPGNFDSNLALSMARMLARSVSC